MFYKLLSNINDTLIFILVFSFFNDNFAVDLIGENVLKILFLSFMLFNGHAMVKNTKRMNLLHDKLFFVFLTALVVFFLIYNLINISSDMFKSVFTLISITAIVLFFSHYSLKKTLYFVWISMMASVVICFFNDPISQWTFRTSGGTGDPNEFAAQLLAFVFTSIYLYKINKNILFLSISIMFFLFGLFKAGSMSSFLMLGAIAGFLVIKYIFYNFKNFFNYKILLLLIIMIFGAMQVDLSKFEAVANMLNRSKDTHTAGYRMNSWKAGQHMIENHTLVGVGMNEFANNTRKYAEVYIHSPAPHNVYIQLLAESGLVVFILFLIFIFTLLIQNFAIIIHSDEVWLFTAFLSLLLMGMTLGILYDKYFLLYLAITMNVHNTIRSRVQPVPTAVT